MSAKTIYTSTINTPIYASWKCPKCGEFNFSEGSIKCQKSTTKYWLTRTQVDKKVEAEEIAESSFLEEGFRTLRYPKCHPIELRNNVTVYNSKCKKCNSKPLWDKWYISSEWIPTIMFGALISLLIAIASSSFWGWLIFSCFIGLIFYACIEEKNFIRKINSIPNRYVPIFGTLNPELLEYSSSQGARFPSIEDSLRMLIDLDNVEKNDSNKAIEKTKEVNDEDLIVGSKIKYCRKCGNKLELGSIFCTSCGEKIIK